MLQNVEADDGKGMGKDDRNKYESCLYNYQCDNSLLLLRHFLIKPVSDIMEKRRQLIADGLQSAQDAQRWRSLEDETRI